MGNWYARVSDMKGRLDKKLILTLMFQFSYLS